MAIRLYSEFPSYLGTDWRIEIHDTDFVGTETEFTVSGGYFGAFWFKQRRGLNVHHA